MSGSNDNLEFALDTTPDKDDFNATIVNLSQSTAKNINAQKVRISQGGADKVTATDVEITQGGVNQVKAEKMTLAQGGAGSVQAVNFNLSEGGVGILKSETAVIRHGGVGIVCGQTVDLQERSYAGVIFARQVNAANIQTKVLLADTVEGDVITLINTRQAALAGLGFGTVVGLFLLIAGWFRRHG